MKIEIRVAMTTFCGKPVVDDFFGQLTRELLLNTKSPTVPISSADTEIQRCRNISSRRNFTSSTKEALALAVGEKRLPTLRIASDSEIELGHRQVRLTIDPNIVTREKEKNFAHTAVRSSLPIGGLLLTTPAAA
mmetsp:Transcript_36042/g.78705  ORF Transcript_36042/g.78705 Transcript_36042/m.78705 type:complete len:134 (-) Transcript_36042:865-1266(-)|eukprot:CAMPEP_0204492284 /NCGR_PEP_ID=MMETSP0471-20130131/79307_1 /ASSEMBLY_ACC=CAM_ASM_000602 /TAXON_ID=2969 /ORGANISM="Oxyrrhis marina" /LENGTH=133 /DNA_ID=CAMNT_0051496343 /DNA_START=166 /DNA_END=567 /DNA_ORIENTATION=+